MKILVVEDDKKLGGFLRKGLEARGFVVDFCGKIPSHDRCGCPQLRRPGLLPAFSRRVVLRGNVSAAAEP